MSPDHITQLILEYRYWILIPLAFFEGPIVAFFAGTLAAVGYFDVWVLAIVFFVRDLAADGLNYALGHFAGRTKFVMRMLGKIGVKPEHLDDVRVLWERRPGRTMFIGKLSYGVSTSFIMLAGLLRVPLVVFFGWGAFTAIFQYGVMLGLGYFFGNAFGGKLAGILQNIQYAIGIGSLIIIGYVVVSFYLRRRLVKETTDAEQHPS